MFRSIEDNDEPPPSHKSRHRDENVKKTIDSNRNSEHNANHKGERNHSNGKDHHHHRKQNTDGHGSSDSKHKSSSDKHHNKERHHTDHHHKSVSTAHASDLHGRNGIADGDDEENRLIIDIKSEEVKDISESKHHRNDRKDDKRSSSSGGVGGGEHRSDKHKSSRNSEKSPHKSSERSDGHKSSSERISEKSSQHHHRKRNEVSDDASTSSNKRKRPSEDGSPSKQSVNSAKTKKPKTETSTVDEIDSSMGTSFADALGMMMPKISKASKLKNSLKTASSDIIKVSSSHDSAKVPEKIKTKVSPSSSRSEKKAVETPTQPPKLLSSSVKLPPLEPVIAVDFPVVISNNYKPMPLNPTVMECVFNNYNQQQQPKKVMTDEEAFGSGISSKSMR